MDSNIQGRKLVEMLAKSDAMLFYTGPRPKREVNRYTLQTFFLNYRNNIRLALTLVKWESMRKKEQKSDVRYSLALLGDKDYISSSTIDDLMKEGGMGMPSLFTSKYVIIEGKLARSLYNKVEDDPPKTTRDLATLLNQYIDRNTFYTPPQAESLFPDPKMRMALGR